MSARAPDFKPAQVRVPVIVEDWDKRDYGCVDMTADLKLYRKERSGRKEVERDLTPRLLEINAHGCCVGSCGSQRWPESAGMASYNCCALAAFSSMVRL